MASTLSPALPADLEALAARVLHDACEAGLKLATAESCTGGLLASLLTDVPGCSHAFERGFVTYTEEAKAEMLGVDRAMLDSPGPVSEPVARAMAEGAVARSHADLGVSITGFAGEGGPGCTPGLVHVAIAREGGRTLHREERYPEHDRGGVRLRALRTALEMLDEAIQAHTV